MTLTRFFILAVMKFLCHVFVRYRVSWVGEVSKRPFLRARIGLILNHTSLFEPIYIALLPWSVVWRIAARGVFPGADITLNRPLVGRFFKLLAPDVVTITRQRDATWETFLGVLRPDSVVIIAPEGRMKRPTGLDKNGQPMTVRGGIGDVLRQVSGGTMVIAYSGGLHHVHTPGDRFPRLFQRVVVAFEELDIDEYKQRIGHLDDERAFRTAVVKDLEARRDLHCPVLEASLKAG